MKYKRNTNGKHCLGTVARDLFRAPASNFRQIYRPDYSFTINKQFMLLNISSKWRISAKQIVQIWHHEVNLNVCTLCNQNWSDLNMTKHVMDVFLTEDFCFPLTNSLMSGKFVIIVLPNRCTRVKFCSTCTRVWPIRLFWTMQNMVLLLLFVCMQYQRLWGNETLLANEASVTGTVRVVCELVAFLVRFCAYTEEKLLI